MDALMYRFRHRFAPRKFPDSPAEKQPLRRELLSIELLKRHAATLAHGHGVGTRKGPNLLLPRLSANEEILRQYNDETLRAEEKRRITPASEWLLDNFHLIEEQIRTARRHLPHGFSRQLPHLVEGPLANFPRVYDIAVELISHVDGRIDAAHLTSFVAAYQEVTPLKLGELWAIPIMLRLALIENLRRVAALLTEARKDRDAADTWADRMLKVAEANRAKLIVSVGEMAQAHPTLSQAFVAEFWRRIQDKYPALKLPVNWIEERLAEDNLTIEQLVQSESRSQAANQVSVGNSICSLRFLDAMDWREFVETQSVVEQKLRGDPADVYRKMDFPTRDFYRHTVERIAKHSRAPELEVAALAIELAEKHDGPGDGREKHVGFYLASQGVETLERAARMKRPWRELLPRFARHHPLTFYLGGIVSVTCALVIPLVWWAAARQPPVWALALLALVAVLSGSQLGVSLINWFVTVVVQPRPLPRLDFSAGIPVTHATLVAVPTMLTSLRGIEDLLESLEVRYLANRDDSVYFALLSDFRDATQEHKSDDEELVRRAVQGIQALNDKYKSDRLCIFYLFHRPRLWNEKERLWMGYERKRGKLADLNRCLRGGSPECFSQIAGDLSLLPHIQYVITLDTDTQLPRDAARQLAATMAHPLNRPVYDAQRGLIVEGYSILQPRIAVSLPSAQRSRFVQLFSGDPGLDPYTRAVSDVYQDVFHEGSFIGKGIYDVDAFERAVGGRFPENRILSHDLLEGTYARSALVSDVQLFEDFPARYHADVRRRHRWIRGDWQIATWLLPRLPGPDVRRVSNPLTGLSRWKIFDNLRRSLVPASLLMLLALGWVLFPEHAGRWSWFVIAIICLPLLLAAFMELLGKPKDLPWLTHLGSWSKDTAQQAGQALLTLTFLPYDACISLDAVGRTLGRLFFTHRHLLEWQTASEVEQQDGSSLKNFFATMWCAPALAILIGLAFFVGDREVWPAAFPFLALWAFAPVAAWWISLPLEEKKPELSAGQILYLRRLARKTWRFFETFVGPDDHWLPPDNFQENPVPVVATRTSPTNIGLALLCTLSAYDFGYLSVRRLIERLASTLETLGQLERYERHYFNWYDTRTLAPLPPLYVSTVDNGNLAGLLLTLHSGLLEITNQKWNASRALGGLHDTLLAWMEYAHDQTLAQLKAIETKLIVSGESPLETIQRLNELIAASSELSSSPSAPADQKFEWWRKNFEQTARDHREELETHFPWLKLGSARALAGRVPRPRGTQEDARTERDSMTELRVLPTGEGAGRDTRGRVCSSPLQELWSELNSPQSLREFAAQADSRLAKLDDLLMAERGTSNDSDRLAMLNELRETIAAAGDEAAQRVAELEELARQCDELARMDFTLLYDRSRELFSIGYNVSQHRRDTSCYDLLASEARLGSFVCIALGQLPQRHWFALGRLLTTSGGNATLISWSGSMFEYLMPMLVMPTFENTLLDLSCRSAIARQIQYGKQMQVPWGMSESGYNLRDTNANYQYRAFGVPGLGFKRGLAEDIVIAPYATLMALMFAPREACRNLERLGREGGEGEYGFYEAIDFTASRIPRGQTRAIVQSFMVHHQGMGLLALAATLLDRPMQRRFNANPIFKSAELLLHERIPKAISVLYPHELEASSSRATSVANEVNLRVFTDPNAVGPEVHLLSNSRYHVMITHAGGGYSHWNDVALTRWREDATRDCWGTFFYLRDVESGKFWSTAYQPTLEASLGYEAIFSQGRAEFRCRLHDLDAHTEISVSPEDDVEVRRVTLTNHSHESRTVEITSYAEVVLNTRAADLAHPAFSNLFVQTHILPEKHAILCTRRPRSSGDQLPCMFHLLLAQGTEVGEASYETDRSQFLGRGRNVSSPAALRPADAALRTATALSNSEGSVLDPVVAIRRTIRLAPKESARLTLISGIAATREVITRLIEKYQDQTIADRCFELAWTHGLIVLRHLNATEAEAQLYGRLAGALLYHQPFRRANPTILARNRRGQRNLWSFGLSGDLPILVVHSRHAERLDLIREVVRAHAYWRLKGLVVDLVILNEDDSVYRQSLHDQILTFISSGNAAQLFDKPGGIFIRRIDQLSPEDLALLETSARAVLSDEHGTLAEQLQRRPRPEPTPRMLRQR